MADQQLQIRPDGKDKGVFYNAAAPTAQGGVFPIVPIGSSPPHARIAIRPDGGLFVYLRPLINGNVLTHGGQQFKIRFQNTSGDWVFTPDFPSYAVRGNIAEPTPSDRFHYCGKPFDLTTWNGTSDVEIHLNRDRVAAYVSGAPPSNADGDSLYVMFNYFIVDPTGPWRLTRYCEYLQAPSFQAFYNTCPGGEIPDKYYGIYWRTYEGWRDSDWSADSGHSGSVEGQWYTPYHGGSGYRAIWGNHPERYRRAESLYTTFDAATFLTMIERREAQIYNHGTNQYETNPRVILYDFDYQLKFFDFSSPNASSFTALGNVYRYYDFAPTQGYGIGHDYEYSTVPKEWLVLGESPETGGGPHAGTVDSGVGLWEDIRRIFIYSQWCQDNAGKPAYQEFSGATLGEQNINGVLAKDYWFGVYSIIGPIAHKIVDEEWPVTVNPVNTGEIINRIFPDLCLETYTIGQGDNCDPSQTFPTYSQIGGPGNQPLSISFQSINLPSYWY